MYFLHRVLGGGKTSGQIRVGLFWSFFAATPVMMLFGLVKGFLGSGTAENVVGFFGLWPYPILSFAQWFVLRLGVLLSEPDLLPG